MRRLLWKEHRECWLYGLALVISSMLIVAIGTSYTFQGRLNEVTGWSVLPVIISAVMGASTLSREKENHSLEGLVSRSISLDKLVLAKALMALSYSIVAAIASMVVFLLACRPEYRQLINLHDLGCGVAVAVGLTSLGWYYGFGLSIYPRVETNLHILLWVSLVAWMIPLFASHNTPITRWESWSTWVLMVTPLLVIVMHRHCGWHSDKTPLQSGFITIMVLSAIITLYAGKYQSFTYRYPAMSRQLRTVSPDGATALYIVSTEQPGREIKHHWQFVDLRDGKLLHRIDDVYKGAAYYKRIQAWVDSKTAIVYSEKNSKPYANVVNLADNQHSIPQVPTLESGEQLAFTPSANGDYVMYADFEYSRPANMLILDVRHAKWMTEPTKVRNCWWQSDRSVGYIDAAGKRRILPLPGGNGQ